MDITVENKVSKTELTNLTPMEAKRRAAKMEGAPDIPLTESEVAINTAAERLARLKKQRNKPRFVPVDVAGEKIFVKALNVQELNEMALSLGRNGVNMLQITGDDGVRAVNVAMLLACTYDEPETPSFPDAETVGEFLDSPDAVEFLAGVMDKINEENPLILRMPKKT